MVRTLTIWWRLMLEEWVSLPLLQRQMLVLRLVLGYSVSETAAALDVAPGTGKSGVHRTRQQLHADAEAAVAVDPDGSIVWRHPVEPSDGRCCPTILDLDGRPFTSGQRPGDARPALGDSPDIIRLANPSELVAVRFP
jgi:hypothetical protein